MEKNLKQLLFILLFFQFSCLHPNAQITSDKDTYDFGDVTEDSSRTIDFIIHNHYSKAVTSSFFAFSLDVSTQLSSYSIPADSSAILRVKIIANQTGPIEEKYLIKFWDREDSLELSIKANVVSFDYEKNYPPEDFPQPKKENDEEDINLGISFKIIDSENKSPVTNARISLNKNYLPYKDIATDENGNATYIVNNSYNVNVSAPGYRYYDGNINFACDDSVRIIELKRYEVYTSESRATQLEEAKKQSNTDIQSIDKVISLLNDESIETPLDNRFKPNNIVFLLDISISMVENKRIDMLKTSLINMIKILRPQDKISIITFNTETEVYIKPTFATEENINEIIYKIRKLKASGLTNGGEGLKMSYLFIEENFDKQANNQIILSTDGGLNSYMKHETVIEMVSSHKEKIKTSIILLKGYNWTVKYMSEITNAGKGHLLMIDDHNDAKTMLIKEIKSNSYLAKE